MPFTIHEMLIKARRRGKHAFLCKQEEWCHTREESDNKRKDDDDEDDDDDDDNDDDNGLVGWLFQQ